MTQPKTSRIPAPIYAAAGAGELALQQIRKLPTVVTDLGGRVVTDLGGKAVVTGVELRQKATETLKTANLTAVGLREKAGAADLDLDRLRTLATRNAAVVLAGAQAAQERALAAYGALVARGERVVGAGVLEAAETVNADIATTEATGGTTATDAARTGTAATTVTATPADVAEVVEAKPAAKRTRTTRAATTKTTGATPTAGKATTGTPSAKLPKSPTKRTRPAAQ